VSGKQMYDRTSKFDLFQRGGTLKMQSFIHYQFHLLNLKICSDTHGSLYCENRWNLDWASKAL
jgi:hypothetical protein